MLTLAYTPPYDWQGLLDFFAARSIAGVEKVEDDAYWRTVRLDDQLGWLCVRHDDQAQALTVSLSDSVLPARAQIVARLRAQFDLDCQPQAVAKVLGALIKPYPGLRVPGAFDGFEAVVRGILGQQITVAAATTLAGRVATRLGTPLHTAHPALTHAFASARTLAAIEPDRLGQLGIVGTRIAAIQGLAAAVDAGAIDLSPQADSANTQRALKALRGIGEWTAQYAALRALKDADAFPAADYGVMKALGVSKPQQALLRAQAWQPYRAYAALCLWRGL